MDSKATVHAVVERVVAALQQGNTKGAWAKGSPFGTGKGDKGAGKGEPCKKSCKNNHKTADCTFSDCECKNCGFYDHKKFHCKKPGGGAHDPNAKGKGKGDKRCQGRL